MPIPSSRVIVEGHAIVSEDGMIADAAGLMPPALRNDADWRLFQADLDRAALVVVGRLGHQRHKNPGRRRLVLTRSVEGIEDDPGGDPRATLWNPSGVPIDAVLRQLAITEGVVAVTGGTGAFDLFLPYYDRFALTEVRGYTLADGIPCFTGGHPRFVLAATMEPCDIELIDRGVIRTIWRRKAPAAGVTSP